MFCSVGLVVTLFLLVFILEFNIYKQFATFNKQLIRHYNVVACNFGDILNAL